MKTLLWIEEAGGLAGDVVPPTGALGVEDAGRTVLVPSTPLTGADVGWLGGLALDWAGGAVEPGGACSVVTTVVGPAPGALDITTTDEVCTEDEIAVLVVSV